MTRIIEHVLDFISERVMVFSKNQPLDHLLVVEHEIQGVNPRMITWWWGNISHTERYKLWHPRDHIYFTWEVPPVKDHVGTIQIVREKIGGIPTTLRIRFDDPKGIETRYAHILAGSILDHDDDVIARLTHEYEPAAYGTRMRSTFYLPHLLYLILHRGLRKHNVEEMASLSRFLPELYSSKNVS